MFLSKRHSLVFPFSKDPNLSYYSLHPFLPLYPFHISFPVLFFPAVWREFPRPGYGVRGYSRWKRFDIGTVIRLDRRSENLGQKNDTQGRIFDRSPPWTALAGMYDHQNDGHRYRLRPFVSMRRRRAPEALARTRRHRSNCPTSAEASRVDSPPSSCQASTITEYRLASFCHCLQQPLIYHPTYSRLIMVFTIVPVHLWKTITLTLILSPKP